MKNYVINTRVIEVELFYLYNRGWNGDNKELSSHSPCVKSLISETFTNKVYLLRTDKISDIVIFRFEEYVLVEETKNESFNSEEIPCNTCYGDGEIEYYGRFSETCECCNGTGKINHSKLFEKKVA